MREKLLEFQEVNAALAVIFDVRQRFDESNVMNTGEVVFYRLEEPSIAIFPLTWFGSIEISIPFFFLCSNNVWRIENQVKSLWYIEWTFLQKWTHIYIYIGNTSVKILLWHCAHQSNALSMETWEGRWVCFILLCSVEIIENRNQKMAVCDAIIWKAIKCRYFSQGKSQF